MPETDQGVQEVFKGEFGVNSGILGFRDSGIQGLRD